MILDQHAASRTLAVPPVGRRAWPRYLVVALVLGALAGLEFLHEYLSGDAPDAALCLTPESQREAVKEALLHHMRGH